MEAVGANRARTGVASAFAKFVSGLDQGVPTSERLRFLRRLNAGARVVSSSGGARHNENGKKAEKGDRSHEEGTCFQKHCGFQRL
jgi:hypothetical protein